MTKQSLRILLGAALISLLAACGGGGGGDRAAGVEPGPPPGGGPVDPTPPIDPPPSSPDFAEAEEIIAAIISASIPDDGQAVVDFQVTDGRGVGLLGLERDNVAFVLSKLQLSSLGAFTGSWQSYVNVVKDPEPGYGTGTEAVMQATYESSFSNPGELTNNGDGTYRYRYTTNVNALPQDVLDQAALEGLDVSYEPDLTHRVAIQFNGGANGANPWYDFIPQTGATEGIFHMDIAMTANCNRCHEELSLHNDRIEVPYCVTCHNPGSTDPESTNTVDMKVMIHKIHAGANLPSVQGGEPYIIWGYQNRPHDYSNIHYPQDLRNCQNCHVGTGTTNDFYPDTQLTVQGDNWINYPTRAACGSCHDDVIWEEHARGQEDDSGCAGCHGPEGRHPVAEKHAMLVRDEGAKYHSVVELVTSSGPGEAPSVDIRVTNPYTGEDYNILSDDPFTNPGASLNVKLGWATTDYTNTGNGETNASAISQSALDIATTEPNGDGSFNVQFTESIPVNPDAQGSGVAVIDGHPTVDVDDDGEFDNIWITDATGFFSINEADGTASPRRKIVELDNCLSCHQNIQIHGQNRADNIDSCVSCHNPRNTDRDQRADASTPPTDGKDEESIDFKTMVHGIHAAKFRDNPLQIVGFRGFTTYVYGPDEVHYPGELSNCLGCHEGDSYTLPLADTVLGTTNDTGDNHLEPVDDIVTTPATATCSSCHDSNLARSHMEQNGGSFATTQQAIDDGDVVEQCALCHAPGRSADPNQFHNIRSKD